MDILKNDVTAILGQIFDMDLLENKRHFTMTPGLDKQNTTFIYFISICPTEFTCKNGRTWKKSSFFHDLAMIVCLSKNQKSFLLGHQESDFREGH